MRKPHRSNDAIRMGLAAALLSAVALPAAALDIESAADAAETMMKLRCSLDPVRGSGQIVRLEHSREPGWHPTPRAVGVPRPRR